MIRIIQRIKPNSHRMHIIRHGMHLLRPRILRLDTENIGAAFGRAPQGRGAPLWLVSLFFLVFLYIWATILVIRMVALAARMVSRYHPNHPSLSPRPE